MHQLHGEVTGVIRLTKSILMSFFRRPVTRKYPAEKRPAFPGARGYLDIRIEDCIYCGACQKRCPADAIVVTREPKTWTLDPYKCIVCGYCVEACPKKCLFMAEDHRKPVG